MISKDTAFKEPNLEKGLTLRSITYFILHNFFVFAIRLFIFLPDYHSLEISIELMTIIKLIIGRHRMFRNLIEIFMQINKLLLNMNEIIKNQIILYAHQSFAS